MLSLARHQEICRQFAALLSYPERDVAALAASCAEGLAEFCRPAAAVIRQFADFAGSNGLTGIEEAYTGTFELQALCHPYVGYQLCGENQQRTFFMLRLRELYNHHGFMADNELPDHFREVLRFVGTIDDPDCREELIADGLLPALEKCLEGAGNDQRPYLTLVRGVRQFLAETAARRPEPESGSASRQKEYCS